MTHIAFGSILEVYVGECVDRSAHATLNSVLMAGVKRAHSGSGASGKNAFTARIDDGVDRHAHTASKGRLEIDVTAKALGAPGLKSLPESVGALKGSQRCICKVSQGGRYSVPESVGELWNLYTLHLGGCRRLTSLPELVAALTVLHTLHLE